MKNEKLAELWAVEKQAELMQKNTILKALGFESDKDKDERARQKRIENLRAKQIVRADFELPTQRQ